MGRLVDKRHRQLLALAALGPAGPGPMNEHLIQSWTLHNYVNNLRVASLKAYDDRLSYLVNYANGIGKSLATLRRHDIESYLLSIRGTVSPTTINGRITTFKVFYNYLCKEDLIDHNPMDGIRQQKVDKIIKPVLNAQQISLLLNSFDSHTFCGTRDRTLTLTILDACLRVGELVGLKKDDCVLTERALKVRGKSRTERWVPITARTAKAVQNWFIRFRRDRPGEHVFCFQNGDPMHADRIRKIIVAHGGRAGFKCYPHMLRRSGATAMHERGMDIFMVSRILGHTDIRTTQAYICHGLQAVKDSHSKYSIIPALDMR